MPTNLTAVGTCSYNGYTFSEYSETMSIDLTPVMDQAGRTVVYVVWAITMRDRIFGTADAVNTAMNDIQSKLTAQGGALAFAFKGYGDLNVNAGGFKKDVVWGPKVRGLKIRLLGRDMATEILWTVEVAVPQCTSPAAQQFSNQPLEINYRVTYSQDSSGYARRTVSGHIRIVQTRAAVNNMALTDNADSYRHRIVPESPNFFRRINADFTLDESKCRLDYTIVDEEMPPNVPPPGIVQASATHSLQTNSTYSGQYTATLSATYEIAKDQNPQTAYFYFLRLYADRFGKAQANARYAGKQGAVIPRGLSFSESEIYGRTKAQCSATYTVTCDKRSFLAASGLWMPIPDSNYALWRQSMRTALFGVRAGGFGNLIFQNSDDIVVDLCHTNYPSLAAGAIAPFPGGGGAVAAAVDAYIPDPNSSFLDYQLAVRVDMDNHIVEMKHLPLNLVNTQGSLSNDVALSSPTDAKRLDNPAYTTLPYGGSAKISTSQRRVYPSIAVTLTGRAVRVGYQIDLPTISSFMGTSAIPANREGENFFEHAIVAVWFGVPVVAARWSQRYIVENMPIGTLEMAPTPMFDE